jgi:hypothetical protein
MRFAQAPFAAACRAPVQPPGGGVRDFKFIET